MRFAIIIAPAFLYPKNTRYPCFHLFQPYFGSNKCHRISKRRKNTFGRACSQIFWMVGTTRREMAKFHNENDDGRRFPYLRKTNPGKVRFPCGNIGNRRFSQTVGFLSESSCGVLPNWQHRVDETPSPEVEDETRYHRLGDHPSKTTETLPRE